MHPCDEARNLAFEARRALESPANVRMPVAHRETLVDVGATLLRGAFDPPLFPRRPVLRVGRALLDHQEKAKVQQLEARYEQWYKRTDSFLGQVSIAYKNISSRGNSGELQGRLASTRRGVNVETRLRHGATLIESLAGKDLVRNADIPGLLRQREDEAQARRTRAAERRLLDIPATVPGMDGIRFPGRLALQEIFSAYPDAAGAIEGAIDTLLGNSRDRFRQAMASCRVALESMAKRTTNENDWKAALRKRAGRSRSKVFSAHYHLLSSGAHDGRTPDKQDAELAVRQTISLCIWLVENADAIRPAANDSA